MISQETIDYLRENLRIVVDFREGYYYESVGGRGGHRLEIELHLGDEVISKTYCDLPQ